MEYDDYESNDREDILFSDNEFALETDTDDLTEIVSDESDIKFYDYQLNEQIAYETQLYAEQVAMTK
jgi:hypothetical protein